MFEPFPGNYVWNLSVNLALYTGGNHGEIDAACRPLREAAARGEDAGTAPFFDSWVAVADRVAGHAEEDLKNGRALSAAAKLKRCAIYYQTAERMQSRDYPPRKEAFRKALDSALMSAEPPRMTSRRCPAPCGKPLYAADSRETASVRPSDSRSRNASAWLRRSRRDPSSGPPRREQRHDRRPPASCRRRARCRRLLRAPPPPAAGGTRRRSPRDSRRYTRRG